MKFLFVAAILALFASCEEKTVESKPAIKAESTTSNALPEELQDPEDCDDKVEKLEEEPVEINLGEDSDAGCTIE